MKKIIFLLLFLFSLPLHADEFNFVFANDFFAPDGKDRWLTNDIRLEYKTDYAEFALGSEMYTPTDKQTIGAPVGDRPWDGYTYLEIGGAMPTAFLFDRIHLGDGEKRNIKFRLGALGLASGSEVLQDFIHNELGFGSDPSWDTINDSTPALEVIYSHDSERPIHSYIGDGLLKSSYGIRAGNVIDEIFLNQEIHRILFDSIDGFIGMEGKGVLFNTFLDGRMFANDVYTVDTRHFVASAKFGFIFTIMKHYILTYEYKYITEEFKNQPSRHLYGTITLGYKW